MQVRQAKTWGLFASETYLVTWRLRTFMKACNFLMLEEGNPAFHGDLLTSGSGLCSCAVVQYRFPSLLSLTLLTLLYLICIFSIKI